MNSECTLHPLFYEKNCNTVTQTLKFVRKKKESNWIFRLFISVNINWWVLMKNIASLMSSILLIFYLIGILTIPISKIKSLTLK
jgi:hypothetical protein